MDESYLAHAERIEQESRDNAIAIAARLSAPQHHPDFDGEHCVICGGSIPAARLGLGKVRCVECQARIEQGQ